MKNLNLNNISYILLIFTIFLLPFTKRSILSVSNSFDLTIYSDFYVISIFLFQIPLYLMIILFSTKLIPNNIFITYNLLFLSFILIKFWIYQDWLILYFESTIYICIFLYYVLQNKSIYTETYKLLTTVFLSTVFIQIIIAILQLINQSNLGLHILGETVFNPQNIGSAKFLAGDMMIVRPYGTFMHPNILSAFILISAISIYFLHISARTKTIYWILCLTGMISTMSRIGIISMLLFFLIMYIKDKGKLKISILSSIIVITIISLFTPLHDRLLNIFDESMNLRLYYYQIFVDIIKKFGIFGIPTLTFFEHIDKSNILNLYPWEYQFIHNSFILILTILGIIGTSLVVLIIYSLYKTQKYKIKNLILFIPVIFFALFEHNIITSQQILFFLSISFCIIQLNIDSKTHKNKVNMFSHP